MSRQRFTQFSIASLLLFTVAVAIAARLWPLLTDDTRNESGEWAEYYWYENGICVAEHLYGDKWGPHHVAPGNGTHLSIRYGTYVTGIGDGGTSDEINIQLPAAIAVGDTIDLFPFVTIRAQSIKDAGGDILSSMKNGEVTVSRFSNPLLGWLIDKTPSKIGTV